jgi:signal transduction histidine kinase
MKSNLSPAGQSEGVRWTEGELWRMLGHDLRTPLNGIQGFLDLLVETPLDADQRELVETAIESTESLRSILDGILENAQMETGRLFVSPQATDVRSVVTAILNQHKPQADRYGLKLTVDVAKDVPSLLSLDKGKLQQILNNLIGNAIKFTQAGGISIRVSLGRPQALVVEVRDSGVGIPDGQIPRVFEAFYRCRNDVRPVEGAGLGLAIVQKLVDVLGGRISIGSNPGLGTTVTLLLPCNVRK